MKTLFIELVAFSFFLLLSSAITFIAVHSELAEQQRPELGERSLEILHSAEKKTIFTLTRGEELALEAYYSRH